MMTKVSLVVFGLWFDEWAWDVIRAVDCLFEVSKLMKSFLWLCLMVWGATHRLMKCGRTNRCGIATYETIASLPNIYYVLVFITFLDNSSYCTESALGSKARHAAVFLIDLTERA